MEDARAIDLDALVAGTSCRSDPDTFRISVENPVFVLESLDGDSTIVLFEYAQDDRSEVTTNTITEGQSIQLSSNVFGLKGNDGSVDYRFRIFDEPIIQPMCEDDRLEPDNEQDQATTIGAAGARVNGAICPDDEDWFRIRQRNRDREGVVLVKTLATAVQFELSTQDGEFLDRIQVGTEEESPWATTEYPDVNQNLFGHFRCVED